MLLLFLLSTSAIIYIYLLVIWLRHRTQYSLLPCLTPQYTSIPNNRIVIFSFLNPQYAILKQMITASAMNVLLHERYH